MESVRAALLHISLTKILFHVFVQRIYLSIQEDSAFCVKRRSIGTSIINLVFLVGKELYMILIIKHVCHVQNNLL